MCYVMLHLKSIFLLVNFKKIAKYWLHSAVEVPPTPIFAYKQANFLKICHPSAMGIFPAILDTVTFSKVHTQSSVKQSPA